MRLFAIIYSLAGPTLAGILITAALTMNMFTSRAMIASAVIGSIVALPISWFVAKQINENM
jgi:urea transporter